MKKIIVALLLMPSVALANPPEVLTYPTGDDKITVLNKGEVAPYSGQLFDDDTALRWAIWLRQYRERHALSLEYKQRLCDEELKYQHGLQGLERQRAVLMEEDLKARLKESQQARLQAEEDLRNPGFFKRPGTWFGIGVLSTVLTSVAAAVVVTTVSK